MRLCMRSLAAPACALLALGWAAAPLRADVLVLKNGKTMKGVIEEEDAQSVKFSQAGATLKIPRANVKSLEKEPKAQGLTRIGEDLRQQNKLDEAIKYYQQALQADPNFKPAQDQLKEAQDAIDAKKKSMRQDAVQEIGAVIGKVREGIRGGDFEKCEKLLKDASSRNPSSEQKPELKALVAELYLAWARDYVDRFDKGSAEAKLNIALAADPQNTEVIELLLKIWEDQPEKREEITRIYETVLQKKPEDATLRRKLGDLYFDLNKLDKAVYHYLEIYKSAASYKASPLEARIIETLKRLHAQYAQKKDFDKAIYYHDLLATIDPGTDPTERVYYEFLKMANSIKKEDIEGRVALAEFAEKYSMEQEMLDAYRMALKLDPANKKAKGGIDRYAMALIGQAQQRFNDRDFYTAKTLAERVRHEFPGSEEAGLKAQEIVGASNNEIVNDKRAKRDQAVQYVKRGDTYYEQAMAAYDKMTDKNYVNSQLRVSNPKNDAIRYFQAAVQAYEAALGIDASLKNDPGVLVAPRLDESKQFLQRLTGGPSPYRQSYGRIIDPNSSYISHDLTR